MINWPHAVVVAIGASWDYVEPMIIRNLRT